MQISRPVSLNQIKIDDPFWGSILELTRTSVLPYQWEALNDRIEGAEKSYCIRNFRVAAGLEQAPFGGCVFQDSDLAKWLEAVAYTLEWHPDAHLEALADGAIDLICRAQQNDGYLDTYYIINGLDRRWTNLKDNHELYCAGHMIEAAVAYYQATGKRALLDAMIRYVDHIDSVFGPEEGKKKGYPGHEVIEMALVKLYGVTGDEKHLRLAEYFINQRGQSPLYFEQETREHNNEFYWKDSYFQYQYYQAGKPVRDQDVAEGHAVRAAYLYSGMIAVACATGDETLRAACDRLWYDVTRRQMYVTGSIGSSEYGEAFTYDYDLPNDTVYAETCAAIALVFFAQRMLNAGVKSEYADVMERALYNGIISGMSLDGRSFFYVNPLEVAPEACEKDQLRRHVKPVRQKWFGCACCPPNLARLMASLGQYALSHSKQTIFVHLYLGASLRAEAGGRDVHLSMRSGLPWSDGAEITYESADDNRFELALRVPAWSDNFRVTVNDTPCEVHMRDGYACLDRLWQPGDTVKITFGLRVRVLSANPLVREDAGKVCVSRGPLIYCLEQADNGAQLHRLALSRGAQFTERFEADLLGGVVTLSSPGLKQAGWADDALYSERAPQYEPVTLKWIPYYAWANRGVGEMCVWVREDRG